MFLLVKALKLNIAVINGDGVGPEMMTSALLILETTCRQFSHELTINKVLAAGEAIDICKNPLPDESLRICKKADAVLFGNSGLEKYQNNSLDQRPEYALMKLRKEVGVTTNIRPIHLYEGLKDLSPLKKEIVDKGFDIVFVRDIVGGVFCSDKVKAEGFDGLEAYEFEYYNEKIILDTAHLAFAFARERRRKLLSLDKAKPYPD
jgi:3-isopropylmalate dehydrogenase